MPGVRSALIILANNYEDPGLRRLRAPGDDAEALARVLGDQAIGAFEVTTVANEPEHQVRREIAGFFANRQRDDLLLLYFSCHAIKDDSGQLYFATVDTELVNLDATAIPAEFVNRHLNRSQSRRVVLLLDCCFSGAYARELLERADAGTDLMERFDSNRLTVLTASSEMEYAFADAELAAGRGRSSMFTRALVQGLETGEADRDGDGFISVDELYDYVFDQVRRTASKQTPGRSDSKPDGNLLIARTPRSWVVSLPARLRQTLEHPSVDVRLEAIENLERLMRDSHADIALAAEMALRELTHDDSQRVSSTAAMALAELAEARSSRLLSSPVTPQQEQRARPALPLLERLLPIGRKKQEDSSTVATAGQAVPGDLPRPGRSLALEVVEGDIITFAADVVAFKYAQGFHGADWYAAQALAEVGVDLRSLQPKVGEHRLVEAGRALAARHVLFVGASSLGQLGYRQIREFGAQVIRILSERVPDCRQLAMTLHGPGFGLDEVEALFSLLTGCMEAVAGRQPSQLERISVVERDAGRVGRLRRALREASHYSGELSVMEAERGWLVQLEGAAGLAAADQRKLAQLPGMAAEHKPHIFVAMPFAEEFSDLFEFGIQRPVRDLGFLCERVDQDVFTGDIMERIKSQIETSAAIIAVLTGANPNVYLEVGYALGRERPTILVSAENPRFDLQGRRCLRYRRIKDVEEMLTRDLRVLKEQGHI